MNFDTDSPCRAKLATGTNSPARLLLQWHITDKCNLRCRHCYQDDYRRRGLAFGRLVGILDQYEMLLASLSEEAGRPVCGHINITGGEPFVREDFLQLLKEVRARQRPFSS
jgi:MoaA/NifB/PqqE/SkfB family radical SAM enzyme